MGSTPLNQSDNEPREGTDPVAAINSSNGADKPADVVEPAAEPTEEAADAIEKAESDTQELNREEVVALISSEDGTQEDADEPDRSIRPVSEPATDRKAAEPRETAVLMERGLVLLKWLVRSAAGDSRIFVSVGWRLAFFERCEAFERRIVYFFNRVEGPDTRVDGAVAGVDGIS